ncbi:MAG TPA: amino acid--tRNA ligase-related protein [Candidatus Dormibacteraeota bacterium]|nr:amino acid--tRNA ligase-related protein [Candidatus Dormibacteraeota bacterium]
MSKSSVIIAIESLSHVGQTVTVKGWVHNVRDLGQIAFVELRDHTGILQLVTTQPDKLPKLANEYVIEATGKVQNRSQQYINAKLATGTVELDVSQVEVISPSLELPFEVRKDTRGINEELRLKHRYLDLRTERMIKNIKLRHNLMKTVRAYLDGSGFIEVDTPLLTKGTPEGAREFLVPSRLHPGEFYVLPQSPQQFKQLLMVGGIGRYYQIAKCLRDEDQRGDRQPEFTQIDIELAFADQEAILQLNEDMMRNIVKAIAPDKKISSAPFPRLSYDEAIKKHKTDRPDLRKDPQDAEELAFAWVVDFPMFERDQATGNLNPAHHPFTSPQPQDIPKLDTDPSSVKALAYDLVLNGEEIAGGSIRIHQADLQSKLFKAWGLTEEQATERFGHMLAAFEYGAPPHGGIAYGFDRLLMILAGEPNIREVIAFPKTGDGRDPLTGSPAPITRDHLTEAHIEVKPPKKDKGN